MQMQYSSAICLYCAKISRDRIKKSPIFRTSSQQMLKYTTTSCFKNTNHSYGIHCSCHSCKCFRRVINAIVFVLYTCKDQYQCVLEIRKIDRNPQQKHFVTQHQSFDISGLVCAFGKGVGSFGGNYLNLLFEHQDVGISTFIGLFNFSCNSFKLGQSDSIDFSASFSPKLSFGEQ